MTSPSYLAYTRACWNFAVFFINMKFFFAGAVSNIGEYTNVALSKVSFNANAFAGHGVRHASAANAREKNLPDFTGILHCNTRVSNVHVIIDSD